MAIEFPMVLTATKLPTELITTILTMWATIAIIVWATTIATSGCAQR